MREIKFRAWYDFINDFVYFHDGCYWYHLDDKRFGNAGIQFDWDNAEQYTGLKDKNGKEIYEGDILRLGESHVTDIFYEEGSFWYHPGEEDRNRHCIWMLWEYQQYIEIIGNIHEATKE